MIEETFIHILSNGESAKFTISSRIVKNQMCYFANVVGTDIDFYKKLSTQEQREYLVVEVSDGNGNTVYYKDKKNLKNDLIKFYGNQWLKSEIKEQK